MPWRFRRSLKVGPRIPLNLSKGGISTSIGGRGHSVNFGKRGMSYRRPSWNRAILHNPEWFMQELANGGDWVRFVLVILW